MGDENPRYTLGDYSRPSHEGYQNTIEVPNGNELVPLRSDTIRLMQNGCSFHGLQSEDPNQHLKNFFKLNWLERLLAGSIFTWEDLTTRFLAQFFPSGRTSKLRNDILMFQQHQGKSLSKAWTRFKELLQKVPHHGIDLWLQIQIFYDYVNPITRRTINQAAGGKLRDKNDKESWSLLEDLALYDNESWNDPRDLAKPVNAISMPYVITNASDRHLIELENQVQRLLEETGDVLGLADGTKSYPVGIMINVEVHVGKLKLFEDFYVVDMEREPTCPLLAGRGFLATANVVIDCKKAKMVVEEGLTRSIFGVKELDFGDDNETYWTTIGKRESYKPRTSKDGIGA
ncbi:zinc finger, CCHC-type containing protein [Tanacetum coccineum]